VHQQAHEAKDLSSFGNPTLEESLLGPESHVQGVRSGHHPHEESLSNGLEGLDGAGGELDQRGVEAVGSRTRLSERWGPRFHVAGSRDHP
jgi:hypothetical protein